MKRTDSSVEELLPMVVYHIGFSKLNVASSNRFGIMLRCVEELWLMIVFMQTPKGSVMWYMTTPPWLVTRRMITRLSDMFDSNPTYGGIVCNDFRSDF